MIERRIAREGASGLFGQVRLFLLSATLTAAITLGLAVILLLIWNAGSVSANQPAAPAAARQSSAQGASAAGPGVTSTPTGIPSGFNTPTGTPTHHGTPTATITITATPCVVNFPDVDPNNVFKPFIQCLVCKGIVSGYPDGKFRPGTNVTRGQVAKFVSNAKGYNEVYSTATFSDVPTDYDFFQVIERLYHHNIIGGYTRPEDCPTGAPCFKPANTVTRGQIAAFVSNAKGYTRVFTTPTFSDVPASNVFFQFIERLNYNHVIGGYTQPNQCPGGNAPCFKPANPVTRGQVSAFVANAFFPNCQTAVDLDRP